VLLSDEPVGTEDEDLLGAWEAAGRLAALLAESRGSTPFTLAVDAGWGMGKSTLMRMVERRLRQEPGIHTVWYNAWSSTGTDALEGLIKSVLARLDRNVLRRAVRRARAASPAARQAARLLSLLAAGPLGVAGLVDDLWKHLSVDPASRNGMRDALRELVAEWADAAPPGAPGRVLVVFVDDLDRCSQQTVLALCEALKVYLDVPGLAFVVGCDAAALEAGGPLDDLDPAGAAFMEKILQTSYRIPASGRDRINGYVLACAQRAGFDLLDDALVDPLVELIAYRAGRNPRRVKRLVNGLLLEVRLNPVWRDVGLAATVLLLLLRYLYPDFHRLMTNPGGAGPGGDVVREFQEYRDVLRHLASPDVWEPATAVRVAEFARRYAVPPPSSTRPGPDRYATLAALEDQLPTGFPALARDPAFTSLLGQLTRRPDAARVLRLLREGPEPTRDGSRHAPGHLSSGHVVGPLGYPGPGSWPPDGPGRPPAGDVRPDGAPGPWEHAAADAEHTRRLRDRRADRAETGEAPRAAGVGSAPEHGADRDTARLRPGARGDGAGPDGAAVPVPDSDPGQDSGPGPDSDPGPGHVPDGGSGPGPGPGHVPDGGSVRDPGRNHVPDGGPVPDHEPGPLLHPGPAHGTGPDGASGRVPDGGPGHGPGAAFGYGRPDPVLADTSDGSPARPTGPAGEAADPLPAPAREPGSSVSPALDPDDPGTFPPDAPDWYAQPRPRRGEGPRPSVVLAGFDSVEAARLGHELSTAGVEARYAFNDWVWRNALATAAPASSAVLCHAGGFGRPDGFDLVRGAREDGYQGPIVLYTPRLTPRARREAERLPDVRITDDALGAVADLTLLLAPPPPAPASGTTGSDGPRADRPRADRPRLGGHRPEGYRSDDRRIIPPPDGSPEAGRPGSGTWPDGPGSV
jgi:hypothetical protein